MPQRRIAKTAAHRLKLEAGRRAIAARELQHGALTATELVDDLARAREVDSELVADWVQQARKLTVGF